MFCVLQFFLSYIFICIAPTTRVGKLSLPTTPETMTGRHFLSTLLHLGTKFTYTRLIYIHLGVPYEGFFYYLLVFCWFFFSTSVLLQNAYFEGKKETTHFKLFLARMVNS